MKRIILICSFFLLSIATVFAQAPEEKASFLTNQMNTLLTLDVPQKEKIERINFRRFAVEDAAKEKIVNTTRYQDGIATNFEGEKMQLFLATINERRAKAEARYDKGMKSVLTPSQYEIYLQNKLALLQAVIQEFGQ